MTTADQGAGWRERAGLVGAPLGLVAAVGGWALFTPLADASLPSDPQLIGAALGASRPSSWGSWPWAPGGGPDSSRPSRRCSA